MAKFKFNPGPATTVILVVLLTIIGLAALWYVASGGASLNALKSTVIGLLATFILLAIAYALLKAVFHYMRLKDGSEIELKLKDLPKDAPDHRPDA